MRYRVGRHNNRLVYIQRATEPTDEDELFCVCFVASYAHLVTIRLNAAIDAIEGDA
jgi:hypothetical protein